MADKFTLFGNSGSSGPDPEGENNVLDDKFFEEFAFDDFEYDDLEEAPDEPEKENVLSPVRPVQNTASDRENTPEKVGSPVQVSAPVQSAPVREKAVNQVNDRNVKKPEETGAYENILPKADQWAPSTEIEPEDPMLSEFESALAAEIQRVTREQEAEKKKIAAVRAARRAENEPARRAIDERNSQAYVSGESIRTGGWYEVEKRGGWSRRRRASQAKENFGEESNYSASGRSVEPTGFEGKRQNEAVRETVEPDPKEEARRLAREQERAREAALRAERVKAAREEYAEAERQAALAREREAEAKRKEAERKMAEEAENKRREEENRLREAEKKTREEEEKDAFAAALQKEQERLDREEAEKKKLVEEKAAEQSDRDDDDDDDDDDDEGNGRTVVTVSVILILLILGVGAMMTYFWSNLSVSRPDNNANAEAPVATGTQEAAADTSEAAAVESMTAEESRYLEESRAAQAVFEEEQAAALARAEELEKEEKAAKLAEAGMLGLPDISTRDLSEFLTEMPAEGESICKTDSVMYSYDQMVKDLYFMTVQYGDFISTETIGTTLDQRAIYQAVIGNANASKHVIVYYSLEGTDYIDTVLAMNQLEAYCKARKNGTTYKNHALDSIFADVCVHVIPMANPDGVSICQYGMDAIRTDEARSALQAAYDADVAAGLTADPIETYVQTYSANANGVDLNKNFDIGWEEYTAGPAGPSSSGYKGSAAMSEQETQALVNLAGSVSTAAVIGYGTNGQTVEYGYGYQGPAAQGVAGVSNIGFDGLVTALTGKTGYTAAEMQKYDATNAGGASEYFMHVMNIPAVTIKAGSGDVPLNETQMSSIWQANSDVLPMFGNLFTNGL